MDQTAIQPGAPPQKALDTSVQAGLPPGALNGTPTEPKRPPKHPVLQALDTIADLRITVVLFALALLLVFWGTLAQVDNGIWTIVKTYFRSFYVWVPLRVILFNSVKATDLGIPFPGGWLIGSVMLVNLLAAHAVRFKLAWNRVGILMTHAGLIIIMLGEVITGVFAVEAQMPIKEGETATSQTVLGKVEFVCIRTVDTKHDEVVAVPLAKFEAGEPVEDDRLPFKFVVTKYLKNCAIKTPEIPHKNPDLRGAARHEVAEFRDEVSGVDPNQQFDAPAAYMKLTSRKGENLGTWLFSLFHDPQWITIDGQKYRLALRFKQIERQDSFHLTKFEHKVYPGEPSKPKDYHSYIRHVDSVEGIDRDIEIYMNSPYRYEGETFYQSGFHKDPITGVNVTTLQVVRNPGWLMPYISCAVVGIGLLIHFGLTLYKFIDRRMVR